MTDHLAQCHCGAVAFRVRLAGGMAAARRCTCSFCRMRGAVALTAHRGGITFLRGAENLTLYQFNSRTAEHWFCKTCGIHTHHRRRSNPQEFGVNAACLAGISPFDFPELPVMDGENHPSDTGGPSRLAGVLHYRPAPG